jgi:two-component system LytT family sensor kinase
VLNNLLGNRRYLLVYFLIWIFISGIHIILLLVSQEFPFELVLTESLVSNFLLAFLGLVLLVSIFYSNIKHQALFTKIINHLILIIIFLGLWVIIDYLILSSSFKNNSGYLEYLRTTLSWRIGNGFLFCGMIIIAYYLLVFYQNFREKVVKESELKTLIKESELSSLKSQINPHFIFNSLNSISSLTIISPEKARNMIIKLSDFLRYSISQSDEKMTSLKDEMQNINRYLDIEKIRFGDRLKVVENIDEQCFNKKLPGLILQPLVENAVKYGVYESVDQAKIEISTSCSEKALKIKIKNDYDPDLVEKKGEGIGLKNIGSRLGIIYKNENLMVINKSNNTFEVAIIFPQED